VIPGALPPTLQSRDQRIATPKEIQMNSRAHFAFPSTDTVLSALFVGGLTFASALLVVAQSAQALLA
jgi:hypothetical protein